MIRFRSLALLVISVAVDCVPTVSHIAGVDASGHISLGQRQPSSVATNGGQAEAQQHAPAVVRRDSTASAATQAVKPVVLPTDESEKDGRSEYGSLVEHKESQHLSWWTRWFGHKPEDGARDSLAGLVEVATKVDCQWGTWRSFTACSRSCGGGTQSRSRTPDVLERNGGAPCAGMSAEVTPCGEDPCTETSQVSGMVLVENSSSELEKSAGNSTVTSQGRGTELVEDGSLEEEDDEGNSTGKACNTVVNPPENMRKYSSVWRNSGSSRLSMLHSSAAWVPGHNNYEQWMQMDLGTVKSVSGIVTQGRNGVHQWVQWLGVMYSEDGKYWTWIPGILSSSNNVKHNYFQYGAVNARYVRIHPTRWVNWPSMRAGVITHCKAAKVKVSGWCTPMPMNPPESMRNRRSGSYRGHTSSTLDNPTGWWAAYRRSWQTIQVDFGDLAHVSGFIMQGDPSKNYWTQWYKVATSADGKTWKWTGYSRGSIDRNTKTVNLWGAVHAVRYVRVYSVHFHGWPAMRFGIMGCKATKAKVAAVNAIAQGERTRQYQDGKRWRTDRYATAVDRRNALEAKVADRRLVAADKRLRTIPAKTEKGEIGRRFAEQVRDKQEAKRIHTQKVEAYIDRKKMAKEVRHEVQRQRAENKRVAGERLRQKREATRTRHSQASARAEQWRRKRSLALDRKDTEGERARWSEESKRRHVVGPRVEAFKVSEASLHKEMTELSLEEHNRRKEDALWDRSEAERNNEVKDVERSLSTNHVVVAKHEGARKLAEQKRQFDEKERINKTQYWTHLVNAVARGSLEKEMHLLKSELARQSKAKESEATLERIDDAVAKTEHWRARNEKGRKAAEWARQAQSQDDDTAVLDATKQAKETEVQLNSTEQGFASQWKDILVVLMKSLGGAQQAQDGAAKAEGGREEEESKREKEMEDANRKLLGKEKEVSSEEATVAKAEAGRESEEKKQDAQMEAMIAKLMTGEKGLENMEVLMQKVELIRKEKEAARLEQEKLHDDYMKRLTGNLTHDAELHKQYEIERAKAQENRVRRMKELTGETVSETKAEERLEDKREEDEVARDAQEKALVKEEKEEQGEIVSELSTLEQLELAAQRADRQAEENERQREAAEERRVRELLTAAFKKKGMPGLPGQKGLPATETPAPAMEVKPTAHPAVPSTANPDCTQRPDAPYCGRRRRSAVASSAAVAG